MKRKFEKPVFETIGFGDDVITASGCCNVAGRVFPNNCTLDGNPECSCKQNSDPNLPNCV